MNSGSQAAWVDLMQNECISLRLLWSEWGIPYLSTPVPTHGDRPPHLPSGLGIPGVGKPSYDYNIYIPSEDEINEWYRIDNQLAELFRGPFLSGNLEAANEALRELGRAPLGEDHNLTESDLEGNAIPLDRAASSHLRMLDQAVEDWEGEAADNFRKHLVNLEYALTRCQDRIAAIWRAMAHHKRALEAFRTDILDMIEGTYDLIDKAEDLDQRINLTVLSAVVATAAAIAAVPSGGYSFAAWAAVGSALSAGGIGAEVLKVGVASKGEAIHNVVKGGERIVADATEAADRLQHAFHKVTEHLTGNNLDLDITEDDHTGVRTKRPDIVTDDTFDPEEFQHDDQPQGVTDRTSREDLVREPSKDADREQDHTIKDPDDGDTFWDAVNPFPEPPQPDAYEEQGAVREGRGAGGAVR